MNKESLIPGLKFVEEYELTQKEIYVLMPFFMNDKAYSNNQLSELLDYHKTTLHHILQRLKLKRLIVKAKVEDRNYMYKLNQEMLK